MKLKWTMEWDRTERYYIFKTEIGNFIIKKYKNETGYYAKFKNKVVGNSMKLGILKKYCEELYANNNRS